jgi:uncharacterized membrane protein SpoIIM required for sporulation
VKEIVFLNKNAERWKDLEKIVYSGEHKDPDYIAEIYIKITDDLSYAQTYFPGSDTEKYLNILATKVHQRIYKTKKEDRNRFFDFWKFELPGVMLKARRYILYSFLFFSIAFVVGMISSANDKEYSRLLLGDFYVNMTIENIEKGDPMAVYKDADSFWMFWYIAQNNLKVMFRDCLAGILFSFGTIFFLIFEGTRIGTFQYLFYEHNVLFESVTTIWIHGTIEIFSLVVSGGAGIMLGNSILFPGTHKRRTSFIRGARSAVKVLFGLVPFIILAAFLESYVTRHTEWHSAIRIGIIALSLISVVWYFFFYPVRLKKKGIISSDYSVNYEQLRSTALREKSVRSIRELKTLEEKNETDQKN